MLGTQALPQGRQRFVLSDRRDRGAGALQRDDGEEPFFHDHPPSNPSNLGMDWRSGSHGQEVGLHQRGNLDDGTLGVLHLVDHALAPVVGFGEK